uniref:Uncharacterized protein n=1 Tax=Chelydra serpentina TaxID=8475 RepID=A0A8C3SJS8_CHESE
MPLLGGSMIKMGICALGGRIPLWRPSSSRLSAWWNNTATTPTLLTTGASKLRIG